MRQLKTHLLLIALFATFLGITTLVSATEDGKSAKWQANKIEIATKKAAKKVAVAAKKAAKKAAKENDDVDDIDDDTDD